MTLPLLAVDIVSIDMNLDLRSGQEVDCTVGVVTFKRLDLLEKLFESLKVQQDVGHLRVKLVVVDNDPDGSARDLVSTYAERLPFEVFYTIQPEKNIAISRNKCVEHAEGDLMLFIDDDEIADPDWLSTMVQAMQTHQADAIFGRVEPYFHPDAPDWLKDSFLFKKECGPTGTPAWGTHTANSIAKLSSLRELEGPFDLAYGKTSGEDTQMFARLALNGGELLSCRESRVQEYIPLERANADWLLKRARRTGNIYSRRTMDLSTHPSVLVRAQEFVEGGVQVAVASLLRFTSKDRSRKLHWHLKAESNKGRVLAAMNRSIDWGKSSGSAASPYS